MSERNKLISKTPYLIYRVKAKDTTGRWAYYFIHVFEAKERLFIEAIKSKKIFDLEKYGKILASNYGYEPTEKVKTFLKAEYGLEV